MTPAKKKQTEDSTNRIVSLTARVPYRIYEKLHIIRLREHREMLDILREAIDDYLKKRP